MKNLLAILFAAVFGVCPAAERRPNVLFIAVDDMNNDLGCYGHPLIKSPNIDRIAKRGVRFDRAYCQFPLCSPSRVSLMTGLRPSRTRVFDLQYDFRDALPDVATLSQSFGQNGYYHARVGKIFHYGNPGQIGASGLDDPKSWQEVFNPAGRDKTELEPKIINYTPRNQGLGAAMAFLADESGADEDHTDGKVAAKAIELLERHRDRPFFLAVGFYKPHTPWIAPKKYFDLYPLEKILLPPLNTNAARELPAPSLASTRPWPHRGLSVDQARECKRAYFATISFVDAQIGRVLDALERLKLWDNTIVVFWSDHGYHLGEHGLWMKQSNFEESARVPLIIAAPNQKVRGRASSRTVELLDLYPTLTDLAGIAAPPNLDGVSLRPLLDHPNAKWKRPAFTQVQRGGVRGFPGYSVRTERWRYVLWDDGAKGAQLYDHANDPQEQRNLAGQAKHSKIEAQLAALIKSNWPTRIQPGQAKTK